LLALAAFPIPGLDTTISLSSFFLILENFWQQTENTL
jgi:hypothetical protein